MNKHVRKYVSSIWLDLGLELMEQEDEEWLYDIHENNPIDVNKCCIEMFCYWLNEYPDASWNQLIKALREPNINLSDLASRIETMLMPMDDETTTGT